MKAELIVLRAGFRATLLAGFLLPAPVPSKIISWGPEEIPEGTELIFADGFETGNLSEWDGASGEPPGMALPPDPTEIAPPTDLTVASDPYEANSFLWTSSDPVQFNVEPGAIVERRICVIRGRVLKRDGSALRGVRVTVFREAELGFTFSRADGVFDLAANGGGVVMLRFEKPGYFPAFRNIDAPISGYAWLDELVLVQRDSTVTEITSDATELQVARGSVVSDVDGDRQATLFFPPGTGASMVFADGNSSPLSALHVRATEYTVGSSGPRAMPASLPENSGYTYAVELSVDEAQASGAVRVQFNQPVITYLENFLGFPAGESIPAGWLDRSTALWVAAPDGLVVEILSIDGGLAELDVEGSGIPATPDELAALGISTTERQHLALLYGVGQSLWRVPVSHFTPWDYNKPYSAPPDAQDPPDPDPSAPPSPDPQPEPQPDPALDGGAPPLPDPCESSGSIIECENQTLRESISLTGVPYRLSYSSDRAAGRTSRNQISVRVTGPFVPPSLKRAELRIVVAGALVATVTFQTPAPNLRHTVQWNQLDRFDRPLQGDEPIDIELSFVYPAVYMSSRSEWEQSFARFSASGLALDLDPFSGVREVVVTRTSRASASALAGLLAGGWDSFEERLGGWSFDVHHRYNPRTRTLYTGDGRSRYARDLGVVAPRVAGTGDAGSDGDGGPARAARLEFPTGIAVLPDESLLIVDAGAAKVRRVASDGIISTYAGTGEWCGEPGCGDGGPATAAALNSPWGIAVEADGSALIADYTCVRRVRPSGLIETAAGVCFGEGAGDCDDCLATEKELFGVSAVAALPGGGFYLNEEFGNQIHYVGTDGRIQRVVGSGIYGYSGDGGPALQAKLATPSSLAIDPSGSLLISDSENNRIRRVTSNGIIETVAGNGLEGFAGDGGPATQARLYNPRGIAVDSQGRLLIVDWLNLRLRRVSADGVIDTIAGTGGPKGVFPTIPYALQLALGDPEGVAVASTGEIYLTDLAEYHVLEVAEGKPASTAAEIWIPSKDGREVYVFDRSGRHLSTRNSLTGATLLIFGYDSTGLLASIADANGNVTGVARDASGYPVSIIGPYGQETLIGLDDLGYLSSLQDPAGNTWSFNPTLTGLLTEVTDPNNHTAIYEHNSFGRLASAQNAGGGEKTLARGVVDPSRAHPRFNVYLESAEGKKERFSLWRWQGGETRYRVLKTGLGSPDLVYRSDRLKDGSTATTSPDGSTSYQRLRADPVWGPDVEASDETSSETSSGLLRSTVSTTEATLADPFNPFSLESRTERVTVNSLTFEASYDAAFRRWVTESPMGRSSRLDTDLIGRPVESQMANLLPTVFTYDAHGRLETISRGNGPNERHVNFQYDDFGRLSTVSDPLSRQVSFTYNSANRVLLQTLPGGRTIAFDWDAKGNLTSLTPPGRPAHRFTYSPVDLTSEYTPPDVGQGAPETSYEYNQDKSPTLIIRPDGQTISFGYDDAQRLTSITSPRGTETIAYDSNSGHIESMTTPEGNTLTYEMDGPLVKKTTWSGEVNGSVERTYDNFFRLSSISVNGANPISYAYDNDGLLIQAGAMSLTRDPISGFLSGTTLGVVTTSYSYSPFGELSGITASVSGTPIFATTYVRDKVGRITTKVEMIEGITDTYDYRYDLASRLDEVRKNGTVTANYTYDLNGNRLTKSSPAGSEVGTYDDQDRLLTYAGASYTYAKNGEVLTKTEGMEVTTYNHDVFGNLVDVSLPHGNSISYSVDAKNRRIAEMNGGDVARKYLWQTQLSPIAELNPAGDLVTRFVSSTRLNVADYFTRYGTTFRIVGDHLGSARLVVNSETGEVVQRIDFDEWGKVLTDSNPGFQPFGYARGLFSDTTGLTRFNARDYEAAAGRWTSRDPSGFSAGSLGLYEYSSSDPINRLDPFGTQDRYAGLMQEFVQNPTLADANTLGAGLATAATVLMAAPVVAMACAANPGVCQSVVADLLNPNPGDLIPPVTYGARIAPQFYEVWSRQPICGVSRSAHRAAANGGLFDQLATDAQMRGMWDDALGLDVLQFMNSGKSGLRNPPGMIWHHPIDEPSVMDLMPATQHTDPLFQGLLHPDGIGGYGTFYGN